MAKHQPARPNETAAEKKDRLELQRVFEHHIKRAKA